MDAKSKSALDRSEPGLGNMRPVYNRDTHQYILDYLVKTTGRDRQWFYDERRLPAGTRSYAMIPHAMERVARHKESIAREAESRGHKETALELYHAAALDYQYAQHALPYDDHPEKIYLHGKLTECFDRVIALSPVPIERVEIPWEGVSLGGYFYPLPDRRKAPTVVFINGMDVPKEVYPDALRNPLTARGFNSIVIDGPGQGVSNLRKIRITPDNHERAMKTVLDYLEKRPEVDPSKIVCTGFSFGSFWCMRLAAADRRIAAVASAAACYGTKYGLFQQVSPHYKRQFMYMSGIYDEAEFDRVAEKYILTDQQLASIKCPVLMVVGEFDRMCPLPEAWRVYEKLTCPKEFWLAEDDDHTPHRYPQFGNIPAFPVFADWLRDVLARGLSANHDRRIILKQNSGIGQYGPQVSGFWLPERIR